ncbi:MAG TPA: cytochrome c biogenesis protein CcdA, partial [Tepidisphaeraceae bacterium]|nr:cytochrome c biogenesis protein CcdA [Tepidisphaeraceae bacterium]
SSAVPPPPSRATAPGTTAAKSTNQAGPPPGAGGSDPDEPSSVFDALWKAVLAGILFNIVPCVLPVLPIKVLGFVEVSHHHRGKTLLLATVFSLGIVSVFAVLAVLVIVLKSLSWGQQFSNPYFFWGTAVVLFILTLWLFGILNINLPAGAYSFVPNHETYFGNYLWGILTAVLSTPCTGPFFGPLIWWATKQPTSVGVAVMLLAGAGMALPYLVMSAYPELARKFPRVGPWSELFKQMLGFVMLGFTVNFIASRLGGFVIGWWATVPVAAMAAFYLLARTVQLSKNAAPVAISALLAVLMLSSTVLLSGRYSGWFDGQPAGGTSRGAGTTAEAKWTPYSEETVAAGRKANRIVLIKFTATWCYNCQLVELNVYHDARALDALRQNNVLLVKADLTSEDAPGWPLLKQFNPAGGIPLTAIYAPGYDQPVIIPAIYGTDTLLAKLAQLAPTATAGK